MSGTATLTVTNISHGWSGYNLIVERNFTSLWLKNEGGPMAAINLDEARGVKGPDEFRLQLVQLDQLPAEDGQIKVSCEHALTYAYLPAALFWPLVQAVAVRPEGDVRVQLEPGQTALMAQMQPIFRCSASFLVGARSAPVVPMVYFSVPPAAPTRPQKGPLIEGMIPKRRP